MAKIPEHVKNQKRFKPKPATIVPLVEKITAPKFKQRLSSRFFVRLHMTLMLGGVIMSGGGVGKLLLEIGVSSMLIRYSIAVCVAYAIFFLFLKMWLWYIGIGSTKKAARRSQSSGESGFDLSSADFSLPESSSAEPHWSGFGGGSSGGGGATDSWGEAVFESSSSSSSSSSGLNLGSATDLDLGDEGCGVVLLLLALLALLLFGIFGAGIYLIYQSPAILAEVAFQAALASGLFKATKRIESGAWVGGVFKVTVIPFVIALAMAVAFGWAAHRYCPQATKAAEIFYLCGQRKGE